MKTLLMHVYPLSSHFGRLNTHTDRHTTALSANAVPLSSQHRWLESETELSGPALLTDGATRRE